MYNECRHIFTSGKKCQSPALKDQNFCYFHNNNRKRPAPKDQAYEPYIAPQDTAHHLTPLEDADAIQLALSDIVLALAANRIDPRRAQILIYGLQVASQNHRHRSTMASKETGQTVREIHEHEDGTLIGLPKESLEPEEVAASKRPPSLGEILLREAEALHARREAEEQAKAQKAEEAEPPVSLQLPKIQATAEISSAWAPDISQRRGSPDHAANLGAPCLAETWDCPNDAPAREAAQLQRGVIEDGTLKSVRKATITEIWERLDFHSDRPPAARDLT
jgi:hypothetical protein